VREGYATIWETVADASPDADALVHGGRRTSWRNFEQRAARFAGALAAHGIGADAQLALYLFNAPEYLEAHFGTLKLRAKPAPVNFRYRASELAYLLDDADADVLVYHRSLGEHVAAVAPRLPRLRLLVEVDDRPSIGGTSIGGTSVDGAVPYEDLLAGHDPAPRIERSGDDLMLWYTGGTTGMPKGVVWRQQPLVEAGLAAQSAIAGVPEPRDLTRLAALVPELRAAGRAPVMLATTPLVHATGLHQANSVLLLGATVVMLVGRRLDGDEVCSLIEREHVTTFPIIGDVVARRILRALEAAEASGRPYDLSSLRRIHSAGAMLSAPTKDALLSRGSMELYDSLGASEGTGFAFSLATAPGQSETGRFRLRATSRVLAADGRDATPGDTGVIAAEGAIAERYHKDPERSAATFRVIDGTRYALIGDWVRLEADGTVMLLGRGSGSINTGGEKVWPEEVEAVLKEHPLVTDAVVCGVPDDEWGQTVGAVVSVAASATVTADDLTAWVRDRLAGYKVPRRVAIVDEVHRTTVDKPDLAWAREVLTAAPR
jgi:fatty-acyl-CoA synthase